jgi:adenine-specific DNA-methyltransferase
MSRLTDLVRQVEEINPALADDLRREVAVLNERRPFGLNFERHRPETVRLPGRKVRRGDKVAFKPEPSRSYLDDRIWIVSDFLGAGEDRKASLVLTGDRDEPVTTTRVVDDLVVVAEFRDPLYAGLRSTGVVERGGNRPAQIVINGENYHALEALRFAYEGKVSCIYIDPPYNTGARDWKYNNYYVDENDAYRQSKWLAMMERRLILAKELLNLEDSVLIVTIDENEYQRLGLLLVQLFPEARIQMVSSVINPAGAGRAAEFSRTDEYIYTLRFGAARVLPEQRVEEHRTVTWDTMRRSDLSSRRGTRPRQFYPIYVDSSTKRIVKVGEPIDQNQAVTDVPAVKGAVPVFPIRPDGTEMNWGVTPEAARERLADGYLRVGKHTPKDPQPYVISYLTAGIIEDIKRGNVEVRGRAQDGSVVAHYKTGRLVMPTTAWNRSSHDAQRYGTELLKTLIPGRRFPFPKSLYAVEDVLRYFIADKPEAVVLDFFAGSGTTAHAVMRLNRQDGGSRQSISVTNNEVSSKEASRLEEEGLGPGDPAWEALGICEYITKPRIKAAITGKTPSDEPVAGDYRYIDEVPMVEGFDENAEFFELTYEDPNRVRHGLGFEAIAPLLWLRAGGVGQQIRESNNSFQVADTYAILFELDSAKEFLAKIRAVASLRVVYVVADDEAQFQVIHAQIPTSIVTVRLYAAYLANSKIEETG